jgi:hypothetical protein
MWSRCMTQLYATRSLSRCAVMVLPDAYWMKEQNQSMAWKVTSRYYFIARTWSNYILFSHYRFHTLPPPPPPKNYPFPYSAGIFTSGINVQCLRTGCWERGAENGVLRTGCWERGLRTGCWEQGAENGVWERGAENGVWERGLRTIFEPKKQKGRENCVMRNFMICAIHQI